MSDGKTVDGPAVVEHEALSHECKELFKGCDYDAIRTRLAELTEHTNPSIQAMAWLNLSYAGYNQGEFEEALRAARESFHGYRALVPDLPDEKDPRVERALADEHDSYVMQTLALWQMGGAEPTRMAAAMGDSLIAPSTSFDREALETIRLRLLLDVDDLEKANEIIEDDSPDFGDKAMLEVTWDALAFEAMMRLARGVPKADVEESVRRRIINVRRSVGKARQPYLDSAKMYQSRAENLLKFTLSRQTESGITPEQCRIGFVDTDKLLHQLQHGLKYWRKLGSLSRYTD